ncbi:MAG: sensor histidine kinase [Burkholderiales bacterium PBB4]|nr:MAG: sensor histidine kinase [Burkholderiales bacterium PBB4]
MATGLKRRLLLLLFVPLLLVVGVNTWFDLRSAENAALQQDRMLGALVPLLADSVIAGEASALRPPVVLMAPAVDDFLNARAPKSAYALLGNEGLVLVGSPWLSSLPPPTREPEFSSDEHDGTTYRIVSQRVHTAAGDLTVRLADGSDQRQQWLHSVWVKAILPNLLLVAIAGFAINWAVGHALQPLLALKEAVERRSPDDLSALDTHSTPDEVLPLVESLNRLFGMVNAQAENQRRFVADAAHQLRTPLAALQAQVEAWAQNLAVAPMDSAEAAIKIRADQIFQLRHAARRTSQLANQLLALSRVDARSRQSEPWQRVDLKHLCEVLMENYLDTAAARQIDLGLDAAPTHADGLEWLLRELLTNLLDNALKYTPAGGHVTLRCGVRAAPGRDATALPYVEVEDDGPGLDAVQRSRVLERFYRVPGTQGEGNGLGLAIADEIARVHHTTLELQSGAGGRGLSVSITLQS